MNAVAAVRPPLTQVPLSTVDLPAVDGTAPQWPGMEVTSGGTQLYVRATEGRGETTAVYVHGLGGSATNWTDLAGQLSGFAPGFAVDLPGFGRSVPPPDYDYTLDSHASVLADYLVGLGRGPVHLFGNSMGGAISMMLAATRPELVRTLTLISPAVPDLRPSVNRISDRRLPLALLPVVGPVVRRQLAAMPPEQRAQQLIDLCFAHPDRVTPVRLAEATAEYAERARLDWAGVALGRSTLGLIRAWMVPRSRSMWTIAPKVTAPTLVIWGTEDRLVSVRKAPRIARLLPHARLLVLPRTGHVAQMERPSTVARAVLGMWEAVAEGTW